MYAMTARGWKNDLVSYHLHSEEVRIAVRLWLRVYTIDNAYISYDRSDWRKAIDYVRKIGVVATLRKILSRLAEKERNRKFVAIGWGNVVEVAPGSDANLGVGMHVGFIAPFHPECVDEVCLDRRLVRPLADEPVRFDRESLETGEIQAADVDWRKIAGWSRWSGEPLNSSLLDDVFNRVLPREMSQTPSTTRLRLPASEAGSQVCAAGNRQPRPGRKRAVIFGMGQYAKTALAPRIGPYVDIVCWHEIDPTQIGPIGHREYELRTSMFPCDDERYDVYFIAGFHHTHAPISIMALRDGADVVVEKPLATTSEQFDLLMNCLSTAPGRYFAGFHKRYNPLNSLIREDVGRGQSLPISYRAIVYEIPLPVNHWYRWPNSRGRIVSNGCHWIDHFLFLNDFSEPSRVQSHRLGNGDVVVLIDLKNGASCSVVITKQGSARLGVRDIVWVTAEDRTATIIDDRQYLSESSRKCLRKLRLRGLVSTHRMYDEIGKRLIDGRPGDSRQSIEISTRTMLRAEDSLC